MIRIEHLTKRYGPLTAVEDLCLTVPPGELFCFLGPNGAGKTTTIKMLTGLVRPSEGRAWIAGFDIAADAVAAKACVGYIPDMPFLYERLTCAEFFAFCGRLRGLDRHRIHDEEQRLFQVFDLMSARGAMVGDLSHGMRQRLIYAATLLHDPAVLFIDEPLIGLDPRTIRTIKDLLRERVRNGKTVFLTTHILALAEDIGDRIGMILNGRLIALGPLERLLRDAGQQNLEDLFLALSAEDRTTTAS